MVLNNWLYVKSNNSYCKCYHLDFLFSKLIMLLFANFSKHIRRNKLMGYFKVIAVIKVGECKSIMILCCRCEGDMF